MVAAARKSIKSLGAAIGFVAVLVPAARARARCALLCENDPPPWLGVVALVAPEVGVAVKTGQRATARLALSWSWQLPLDRGWRHRIVPSFDLLIRDSASWGGRMGYRYGRRHVFAGAGFGGNNSGVSLSPEIGVKFAHLRESGDTDPSMHLLARGEIAPQLGQLRAVIVLLGWNFL